MSQPAIISLAETGQVQWNGAGVTRAQMRERAAGLIETDADQLFVVCLPRPRGAASGRSDG